MRIDKFLKVSRLLKRRTVAQEACDAGKVSVNGKAVKSSHQLKVGDTLTVGFAQNPITVRVSQLAEHVKKEDASAMYEVISG